MSVVLQVSVASSRTIPQALWVSLLQIRLSYTTTCPPPCPPSTSARAPPLCTHNEAALSVCRVGLWLKMHLINDRKTTLCTSFLDADKNQRRTRYSVRPGRAVCNSSGFTASVYHEARRWDKVSSERHLNKPKKMTAWWLFMFNIQGSTSSSAQSEDGNCSAFTPIFFFLRQMLLKHNFITVLLQKSQMLFVACGRVSPCAAGPTPDCPSHSPALRCWAAALHQGELFRGADCAEAAVVCRVLRRFPPSPKTSSPDSWHYPHQPRTQKETLLAWKTWLCCEATKRQTKDTRSREANTVNNTWDGILPLWIFNGRLADRWRWLRMELRVTGAAMPKTNSPPDCHL